MSGEQKQTEEFVGEGWSVRLPDAQKQHVGQGVSPRLVGSFGESKKQELSLPSL